MNKAMLEWNINKNHLIVLENRPFSPMMFPIIMRLVPCVRPNIQQISAAWLHKPSCLYHQYSPVVPPEIDKASNSPFFLPQKTREKSQEIAINCPISGLTNKIR